MDLVRTLAVSLFASAAWAYVVKPWLDGADKGAASNRVGPFKAIDALNDER